LIPVAPNPYQNIAAENIDVDKGKSAEAVEESSNRTVVIKKVSCSKDGCKCQQAELHGPYKYIVWRWSDSLKWKYEGPVN